MFFNYAIHWDYFPLFGSKVLTDSDSISEDISISIYPYWYKQITIEWSIPSGWGACKFHIYRSEIENGNYIQLTPTALDPSIKFFKDMDAQDVSKFNRSWYIVEALLPNGKRIQSNPSTWGGKRLPFVEIRAQEIQRREWLLLNKFTGIESYILRRKTYGMRCSNCWNYDLQKVVKDQCAVCMGTSFEGGYFPAIKTLVQYDPNPNDVELTYFGKWESNELMAWTIAFPEMRARDLIYRVPDAALFHITDWANTELQTVTIRQLLKLTQLDKDSPEYHAVLQNKLIPAEYQT